MSERMPSMVEGRGYSMVQEYNSCTHPLVQNAIAEIGERVYNTRVVDLQEEHILYNTNS